MQERERELWVFRTSGAGPREMFGGKGEVASITVERAKIVVSLHVCRINPEHSFKFCDGLLRFGPLGQQSSQIVVSTHKHWVELDCTIKLRTRLVATTLTIQ